MKKSTLYIASFVSGFEPLIKELLLKKSPRVRVKYVEDGIALFESDYSYNEVLQMQFFTNVFVQLRTFEKVKPTIQGLITVLEKLSTDKGMLTKLPSMLPPKRYKFKIVSSIHGRTSRIPLHSLTLLEAAIKKSCKLKLSPKDQNLEFWIFQRSHGPMHFALRISYPKSKPKAGELAASISYLMSLLSEPALRDRVLEPFAGLGGLLKSRARNFPFKSILAVEKDQQSFAELECSIKDSRIELKNCDYLTLESGLINSIDKVITDPPWGHFSKLEDIEEFYNKFFNFVSRVLHRDGILVLLLSRDFVILEEDLSSRNLTIQTQFNILVNGKKASIYKILKK